MATTSIAPELLRLDPDGPCLVGGWSPTSGHLHFPLQPVCPYTGADDVVEVELPRSGRLWLWTTVHTAPPGYMGPVPYHLGIVELDGGLRLVTRLVLSDAEPHEGMSMRLTTDEVMREGDAATVVWAFEPAGPS